MALHPCVATKKERSVGRAYIACCSCAQVSEADKEEQEPQSRVQACIFKVGDDCRQDVLALQVVRRLLK